jgi:threonine aldolase
MKETLLALAEQLEGTEYSDVYGNSTDLAAFEAEVAALFGKEAAVFMPSGTMAQQIALRIWCERDRNFTVAMHPTAHPEFAEQLGYQILHGLQRLPFAAPEFAAERMLTIRDFEGLAQKPGAVLLELPYRPLGGPLPSWEELIALHAWASEHHVKLHLDGARIWQCRPFYKKEYHEIAALFDSVYVSFYKDLGGLCGSMLLGPASFIKEARIWQIRHGGRLFTQGPFWASGRLGMKQVLPQIDTWVTKAQEVASVLCSVEGISAYPNPPHVNMFNLYIRGDAEALTSRHLELASETGTFLFFGLHPSPVPGISMTEMHLSESSLRFDTGALPSFLEQLLH